MIRGLRPTDVFAYTAFLRQSPVSAALANPSGFTSPLSLRDFLGGVVALDLGRRRWVYLRAGQIRALAVATARFGADVWDVDRLFLASSPDIGRVGSGMLMHICACAVEDGVQRVFLRLDEESQAVLVARQAGFVTYCSELILRRRVDDPILPEPLPGLRSRRLVDHQSLFRLYCGVTPSYVRQVEGMTLHEWRSTDGWWAPRVDWRLRSRSDRVVAGNDGARVWMTVDTRARVIRVMAGCADAEVAGALVAHGVAMLGADRSVTVVVREYQGCLLPGIEALGFEPWARHVLMAKTLAVRVPEARLVPMRA